MNERIEKSVYVGVGIISAIAAFFVMGCGIMIEESYVKNACKDFASFKIDGVVYECKERRNVE